MSYEHICDISVLTGGTRYLAFAKIGIKTETRSMSYLFIGKLVTILSLLKVKFQISFNG